jgi:phage terminase small subunit
MNGKELSEKHKAFVNIYVQNGRNASEAYRTVYGEKEGTVANTLGSRLLKKVDKSAYFVEKCLEIEKNHGVSFSWAIQKNKEILEDALLGDEIPTNNGSYTRKDRMAALKGVKQITDLFGWEAVTKAKLEISGTGEGGKIEIVRKII